MKTLLVILGFLLCISGKAQNVRIITKEGKELTTRILAVSDKVLFTSAGNIPFTDLVNISFEAKTESDQATYKRLEKAGIPITFTYTFDSNFTAIEQISSSEAGQVTKIYLENQKSHKQLPLAVGQYVQYQVVGSKDHEKAFITGFTLSTISFERKSTGSSTLLHKDLGSLYLTRSKGRRSVGAILLLAGAAGVIVGIYSGGQNNSGIGTTVNSNAHATMLGGIATIIAGIVLLQPRKINLHKTWRIKTSA